MIEHGQGSLLQADAEALVNTVNCVGVMGKGIALQFKQAYPDNFRQYKRACDAGEMQIGKVLVVPTNVLTNPLYIINFPTKHHWKEKSRLEYIESGLDSLISEVRRLDIRSIAVPPLGCGNGGLDWADVKPLIERAFEQLPNMRVLLFEPGHTPAPSTMPIGTKAPQMNRTRAMLVKLLERYKREGYALTLLEIQKLAYFLQAVGEPLNLDYARNKYGPYAEKLNFVLQHINGHFIKGYSDRNSKSEIYVLPDAVKQAEDLLEGDSEAADRLQRVSKLIEGFETPYGMELLATVHWVSQENAEAAADPNVAIEDIHEWSPRKKWLFQPEHVDTAWRRLHDEHWLTPSTAL